MLTVFSQIVKLLLFDAIVILACVLLLIPLAKYRHAAYAVLKRNFIGYFSNPTGYVFLCLFVLLSSFAAFWPHEFFNDNLATLGQLNLYFPYIMLVFIPAITMSVWAEERRQGTDELLLTIPAGDFDIVIGKYLAAGAIYTASLLFSQLSNFAVLNALALGDIDIGLFIATYIGYWFIGMAMLAVGMVASFLTSNLTVGFILGAVFNVPLVFAAGVSGMIPFSALAQMISRWSYSAQFANFGRGVIGLSSTTFFVMIIIVGLYLSMVLIGRRHWLGGKDGQSMLGHYVVRTIALIAIVLGVNVFFTGNDWFRLDATSARVSSLSKDTKRLVDELEADHTVLVEAFISKTIPETYVKTKIDLISMLNEFSARSGGKIDVRIYDDMETFGEDAARAEEQYDIKPEMVTTRERGAFKQEEVFLGAAFTCGLEKVVVPFFDHGIPVEYELIRSICTVANQERQRLGVVRTDAQLFGGFDMQRMAPRPKQLIIQELEKQYEVVDVDPNNPIEENLDVLMVVQPSSLTQPQMDNLMDAIKGGTPTAIFEDPFPVALTSAPGTGQPKRPQGGMMGMGRPPEQKGDVKRLWSMLGMELVGEDGFGGYDAEIIWQNYNPYPKVRGIRRMITNEWVFVGPEAPGSEDPLNSSEAITSELKQLLFLFPGAIESLDNENLEFTALVTTGDKTGTIKFGDLQSGRDEPLDFKRKPRHKRYILAARIRGNLKDDETAMADDHALLALADEAAPAVDESGHLPGDDHDHDHAHGDADAGDEPATDSDAQGQDESDASDRQNQIDVVFVSDIDLLHSDFLQLRARPEGEINWQFDNVTFVLNILDSLAGEEDFVEIRKRQTRHSTLQMVEIRTEEARDRAGEEIAQFDEDFTKARDEAQRNTNKASEELQKKVDEIRGKAQEDGKVNSKQLEAALIRLAMQQQVSGRRLEAETERLRRQRDRKLKTIERDLDLEIVKVQNEFKFWAVVLPPIPPLLVGLAVFMHRRSREQEGITKERMR